MFLRLGDLMRCINERYLVCMCVLNTCCNTTPTFQLFCLLPVSRQIVRMQQIVCPCMILEVSTEYN